MAPARDLPPRDLRANSQQNPLFHNRHALTEGGSGSTRTPPVVSILTLHMCNVRPRSSKTAVSGSFRAIHDVINSCACEFFPLYFMRKGIACANYKSVTQT